MSPPRRVALTGFGVVSPVGIGKQAYWSALKAGRSGTGTLEAFDTTGCSSTVAAEIGDFDVRRHLGGERAERFTQGTDRANQFLLVAAEEARLDAGLAPDAVAAERMAVVVGSIVGDLESQGAMVDDLEAAAASGDDEEFRKQAQRVLSTHPCLLATRLGAFLGTAGDCIHVSMACASSTDALGIAYRQIQRGDADVVFVGGTEAPISPIMFWSHARLRALAREEEDPSRAARPFDRTRTGFVMGESAAVVVLEEWEHARRRRAHAYAEVAGLGMSADAHHVTAPCPAIDQPVRALREALEEARLAPEEVDYVCAHGTGTPINDAIETRVFKAALGPRAAQVPVSAIKSMLGHSMGAAGIMQAVTCALVLEHGFIPPTINYSEPDPECDLDYVPNQGREVPVQVAVQNTLSFFGRNCAIAYRKASL